jgi:hypothetical protein
MIVYHFNKHIVVAQPVIAEFKKLSRTATISASYVVVHPFEITTEDRSPTLQPQHQ